MNRDRKYGPDKGRLDFRARQRHVFNRRTLIGTHARTHRRFRRKGVSPDVGPEAVILTWERSAARASVPAASGDPGAVGRPDAEVPRGWRSTAARPRTRKRAESWRAPGDATGNVPAAMRPVSCPRGAVEVRDESRSRGARHRETTAGRWQSAGGRAGRRRSSGAVEGEVGATARTHLRAPHAHLRARARAHTCARRHARTFPSNRPGDLSRPSSPSAPSGRIHLFALSSPATAVFALRALVFAFRSRLRVGA